jgi:hypothetical protein
MIIGVPAILRPRIQRVLRTGPNFQPWCAALALVLAGGAGAPAVVRGTEAGQVDFDRQIRPLLSDNCFFCHGPDAAQRQADLRLDDREAAVEHGALNPDKLEASVLLQRILTDDPDEMMPPPRSHKKLTAEQKELIRTWLQQGANYTRHWAFEPPQRTALPAGAQLVDHLVHEQLRSAGLELAPPADMPTLARRLAFDLTGLPPSSADVARLAAAQEEPQRSQRIGEYIDQLLASPHYGERMALGWLDVVRFADTIGYHSDTPRNIYPYRDYVIRSFNTNKPFDQFTVEQVAGDLLPDATLEQKVASGFNRLLLTTEEGGAQAKDYEARYLGDRVRAIGTTWLGLTIGCSQCHDHKFDPVTMRDFYSMGAFFADIEEAIIGRREDGEFVPTPEQSVQWQRRKLALAQLKQEYAADHAQLAEAQAGWEANVISLADAQQSWRSLKPSEARSEGGATLTIADDHTLLASGQRPDKDVYQLVFPVAEPLAGQVGLQLEALPHASLPARGSGRADNGNFVVSEVLAQLKRADGNQQPLKFSAARASTEQTVAADAHPDKRWSAAATIDGDARGDNWGWAILPDVTKPQQLQLTFAEAVTLEAGDQLQVEIRQQHGHGSHVLGHFRIAMTASQPALQAPLGAAPNADLIALLRKPASDRSPEERSRIHTAFKAEAAELAPLRTRLAEAEKSLADFEASLPRTLISRSMARPRLVRILPRGNWMDDSGEVVQPALPSFLNSSYDPASRPLTRLDLAQWLVDRRNPLTARVFVNRLWKQFFGAGLSRNLEDLGAQGEAPVNQPLLDTLAVEFMDSGWDVKRLVRLMVSSQAYQQTSAAAPELVARDPDNRLLARQSRYRLPAELVRDNALAISGLLNLEVGGPSVKPYQPDGYWENLNFPPRNYAADGGANQYRRGLYTWWQRSFVHPSMLAFDAPTREECAADRTQSNIPQQALVLLNDPTYVEAARVWAVELHTLAARAADRAEVIAGAFEKATSRAPTAREAELLYKLHADALAAYQADEAAAKALVSVGLAPAPSAAAPADAAPAELAAWTQVARAILNLHEVITRN